MVNELQLRTNRSGEPKFESRLKQLLARLYLAPAELWITKVPFPRESEV
jgi:hypothetical protein